MPKLLVVIPGVEIRGIEQKEGKSGEDGKKGAPFLVVRVDDEAGNRHELLDRDVENKGLYERGKFCDIEAMLCYGFSKGGSWCRLEIKSVKKRE